MTIYESQIRQACKTVSDVDRRIDREKDALEGCPPSQMKEHRIRLEILRNVREELQTPLLPLV